MTVSACRGGEVSEPELEFEPELGPVLEPELKLPRFCLSWSQSFVARVIGNTYALGM